MTNLARWKRRFYPVSATRVSKADALAHALRKWRGMRPAILTRYGIIHGAGLDDTRYLQDATSGDRLFIDASTCALCVHFLAAEQGVTCRGCPLRWATDRRCGEDNTPYDTWHLTGDPEPMIAALEDAQRLVRAVTPRGRTMA